jgi:pimeloyl-ACP methyl ester carboxylesterase
MRSRGATRLALAVLVVLVVAVVAGVTAPANADPTGDTGTSASAGAIAWRSCSGGFQCGTLAVPLDYDQPDGPTLTLAVIRRPADDRTQRIGALVVNPGGPGASGVDFLRAAADEYPAVLRRRFDLVSFDPRGSGRSSPVQCTTSVQPFFDAQLSPADAAQRAQLVAAAQTVAAGCQARSGALLAHVSTQDTARDMDRLRAALGASTLSFIGSSYGTYLGTVYATFFPQHVRAFVLDGAVDPRQDIVASTLGQARGFERALDDFLADCSAHASCVFHHGGRAAAAYDALRARAAASPIPAADSGGRTLDQSRFDAGVLQLLYAGRAAWPDLAGALAAAGRENAGALLGQADAFTGSTGSGASDGSLDSFWAISCLDGPVAPTVADAAHVEALAVAAAPRLGAFVANNSLVCSVWPLPPVTAPPALDAAGAPPELVLGNTRDPATPLAAARALAGELEGARLLVVNSEAHTAFAAGNSCVDDAVTRYLVDRVLPRTGTRC